MAHMGSSFQNNKAEEAYFSFFWGVNMRLALLIFTTVPENVIVAEFIYKWN